jgi:hypothetical protein
MVSKNKTLLAMMLKSTESSIPLLYDSVFISHKKFIAGNWL